VASPEKETTTKKTVVIKKVSKKGPVDRAGRPIRSRKKAPLRKKKLPTRVTKKKLKKLKKKRRPISPNASSKQVNWVETRGREAVTGSRVWSRSLAIMLTNLEHKRIKAVVKEDDSNATTSASAAMRSWCKKSSTQRQIELRQMIALGRVSNRFA